MAVSGHLLRLTEWLTRPLLGGVRGRTDVRGGFDVSHRGTPPGWYARQGRVGRWLPWPVLWPRPEAVRNQALPAWPTKQKRATLRRPRASVTSNRPLAATPARAAGLMPCAATSAADAARQVFG